MNHEREIAEVLDEFREVYGMNLTEANCNAFREVLAACTAEEITFSAVEHLKSSKYAPRPAELLAIIQSERAKKVKQEKNETFWQQTREAQNTRATRGYRVPTGKKILDYIDELMAQGMTREQAVEEVCG